MGFDRQAYSREWMRKRRADIIADMGGKCVVCGTTQELELDHIDPDTKSLPVSHILSMSASNPVRIAELDKCQLLCKACHKIKTRQQKLIEHGINGYRRGCKCIVCSKAKHDEKQRYLNK